LKLKYWKILATTSQMILRLLRQRPFH